MQTLDFVVFSVSSRIPLSSGVFQTEEKTITQNANFSTETLFIFFLIFQYVMTFVWTHNSLEIFVIPSSRRVAELDGSMAGFANIPLRV